MKLAKILSVSDTTLHRIVEEDLRFKSYVIKVPQMLSEVAKMNRFKEFWLPNSPDLNLIDYYVWSVIERVTNKLRPHRDIFPARYRGGIRQYGQGRVAESMPALQDEDRSKRRLYKVILL